MTELQAIADRWQAHRSWMRRPSAISRYIARKLAFSYPLRRLIERAPPSPEDLQRRWDGLMSQTVFATYLGQTITVDSSNAMTATLIKYHAAPIPSVLDVGCAGGTLATQLSGFSRYLGTDVSRHAIEYGRKASLANVGLQAIDLRVFETDQRWDVIVFNEVLYYLPTEEAVRQVDRYAAFLSPGGIICASMKDDPKSSVIFHLLKTHYRWIDGMVWQRKPLNAGYSIQIDRECPGYLLGVFKLALPK
jgi:SAM-dependent methyltransferase